MDNPTQASVQAVANSITKPVLRTALPKAESALVVADITILVTSAGHRQGAEETIVVEVEVTRTTNPTEAAEVPEEDSVEDSVEATVEGSVEAVEATVEEEETVVEEVKPTRTKRSPLKKKVTVNNSKNTQISLHYFSKIIT